MIQIECDAILFDLDGVLVDSTACIIRHWGQWAEQHDMDVNKIMKVAHGRRIVETIGLIAPQLDAEEEARRLSELEMKDTQGITAIAGAAALLDALPRGTWAIATAGSWAIAAARLKQAGLPIPDVLVNADDVSKGKPDPESYLLAARRLGVAPERCVVVEDAPFGIDAGRAARARTIAVLSTHERRSLAKADVIVERLADLRAGSGNHSRLALSIGR